MPQQTAITAGATTASKTVRGASHADRQRRYRCHRAAGLRKLLFDIRRSEIDWLVQHHYLSPAEVIDNDAIARGPGTLLDQVMR